MEVRVFSKSWLWKTQKTSLLLSVLVSARASSFGWPNYEWESCYHRQKAVSLAPRYTSTLVVSFSSSELCLENSLGIQSTEESEHPAGSSLIPFSRESTALMGVVYQDRVPNTTCTQEINCLAVGCLYGVIGMFLHLKLPEGLYKYSAHKYNYSRALARNSHILWDIAVSSPYQSQCKIQ